MHNQAPWLLLKLTDRSYAQVGEGQYLWPIPNLIMLYPQSLCHPLVCWSLLWKSMLENVVKVEKGGNVWKLGKLWEQVSVSWDPTQNGGLWNWVFSLLIIVPQIPPIKAMVSSPGSLESRVCKGSIFPSWKRFHKPWGKCQLPFPLPKIIASLPESAGCLTSHRSPVPTVRRHMSVLRKHREKDSLLFSQWRLASEHNKYTRLLMKWFEITYNLKKKKKIKAKKAKTCESYLAKDI